MENKKMNKIIMTFVLASILLLGIGSVMAVGETVSAGEGNSDSASAGEGEGEMVQVQEGTYMNQAGEQIQIQAREGNKIQLRVGNVEAQSDLEISSEQVQDRVRLRAKLSNGENAEIKVMPDVASETALQRLRLRTCDSENCSIELKQVGEGTKARLAYEVQSQKESKVFGLFKAQMKVKAQVDAENGEVIRVGKPWWAFLATEPEEQ